MTKGRFGHPNHHHSLSVDSFQWADWQTITGHQVNGLSATDHILIEDPLLPQAGSLPACDRLYMMDKHEPVSPHCWTVLDAAEIVQGQKKIRSFWSFVVIKRFAKLWGQFYKHCFSFWLFVSLLALFGWKFSSTVIYSWPESKQWNPSCHYKAVQVPAVVWLKWAASSRTTMPGSRCECLAAFMWGEGTAEKSFRKWNARWGPAQRQCVLPATRVQMLNSPGAILKSGFSIVPKWAVYLMQIHGFAHVDFRKTLW